MLTKTNNQPKQKKVNVMTCQVYTHTDTHTCIYTIISYHYQNSTSLSVWTSLWRNITVCDKSLLFLSNFWVVVDGCGWFFWVVVDGCGCLWVVVGRCGVLFRWLWVVAYFSITRIKINLNIISSKFFKGKLIIVYRKTDYLEVDCYILLFLKGC